MISFRCHDYFFKLQLIHMLACYDSYLTEFPFDPS